MKETRKEWESSLPFRREMHQQKDPSARGNFKMETVMADVWEPMSIVSKSEVLAGDGSGHDGSGLGLRISCTVGRGEEWWKGLNSSCHHVTRTNAVLTGIMITIY
jgi:hypothetical protein